MKEFFNRMAFSFFCLNKLLDEFFYKTHKGILYSLSCFLYKWDARGILHKEYRDVDDYVNKTNKMINKSRNNISKGYNAISAECMVDYILFCYILFLACLLKSLNVIYILNKIDFMYVVYMSLLFTFVSTMFFFRGNTRIRYFKQFERQPQSIKWHVITFSVTLGAIVCFFMSLSLWFHV